MSRITNKKLARIFEEISVIYEIKDDRFRQRAYDRASQTLNNLNRDVEAIFKKEGVEGLKKLPGIGAGGAEKIAEYLKTGDIKEYQGLKKDLPVNIEELNSVHGVGGKAIKTFYEKLGIKTLEELEEAAKNKKIRTLPGFGEKTEKNILQSIEFLKDTSGRFLIYQVLPYARELVERIKKVSGVEEAMYAGSLRRMQETIGDLDILIVAKNPESVFEKIKSDPDVLKVWGSGKTKISVHLAQGFNVDIRSVSRDNFAAAMQYFTGNKAHNVKMRKIAISKGYKLSEYGLFKGNKNIAAGKDENLVYKKLGLQYIPPEMRQDTGEIEFAEKNKIPRLIDYRDLRGDLQIQTNWTDGRHSIEEMAQKAKELGHEYILITDHTKSLHVTGGLSGKQLLEQKKEIENVNKKIKGVRVLSGVEVDVLKDGTLDIEDEFLSQLDIVCAAVHMHTNMTRKAMTERIKKAINNPHVDVLLHPTGRLIKRRSRYDVDMEAVIKEAKKTGTILEINAHPQRLDLAAEHIRMANEVGVKFCISTDAHAKGDMEYLEYGIGQARAGWTKKENVVNTYPLKKLLLHLKDGAK